MTNEHKAKIEAFDNTIERLTPIVLNLLMKHYPTSDAISQFNQELKRTLEENITRGELAGNSDKVCTTAAALWLGVLVAIRSASLPDGGTQ